MENIKKPNRIHPLIAGAAVAVTLVSLVGIAAITGILPDSNSKNAPAYTSSGSSTTALTPDGLDLATDKQAAVVKAPEPVKKVVKHSQTPVNRTDRPVYSQAASVCESCGRVESVNAIKHEAKPSGVGVVAGAVLGGVLGNQVGGGNGRKLATVAGAVGGGYAGNEVEKRSRGTTSYEVRVRMDNGSVRTFPYAESPGYGTGDRVRVVNGHLTAQG